MFTWRCSCDLGLILTWYPRSRAARFHMWTTAFPEHKNFAETEVDRNMVHKFTKNTTINSTSFEVAKEI